MITEAIEEGTPWAMLFADDLVLCDPDRVMMEVRLERTPTNNMGHISGYGEESHDKINEMRNLPMLESAEIERNGQQRRGEQG